MPDVKLSITTEPGATAGDLLLSAAVPTAVAVAAAATYHRLRAGLGAAIAPALATGAIAHLVP